MLVLSCVIVFSAVDILVSAKPTEEHNPSFHDVLHPYLVQFIEYKHTGAEELTTTPTTALTTDNDFDLPKAFVNFHPRPSIIATTTAKDESNEIVENNIMDRDNKISENIKQSESETKTDLEENLNDDENSTTVATESNTQSILNSTTVTIESSTQSILNSTNEVTTTIRSVSLNHEKAKGILDVLFPSVRVKHFKNAFDIFRKILSYTFK